MSRAENGGMNGGDLKMNQSNRFTRGIQPLLCHSCSALSTQPSSSPSMAPTSPLDRFIVARLHANATARHATVLLVGCDEPAVAAVANGIAASAIFRDASLSQPGASLCRSEAEGLVMRAVGTALGAGVWAHAVVVDAGSGGREEGVSAEGAEARRAALEEAMGAEARRGVPCVAWRAEYGEAAEALGDAMAGVVRATAAAFFPSPLPAHANKDAPPALDFDDLAMLSDHNIATRPPSLSPSAPLVRPAASPLARLTAVSAARPALSFQTKCLTPMPVMSACHVAAVNGLAADVSPAHAAVGPAKQATAFPDLMHLGRQAGNTCDPKGAAGAHKTVVQWFRNDLRLHDNEALAAAHNHAAAVLPVYCFDPRDYGKSASGFDRTGPHRARFLLQCVAALRAALRERGSDLVVRVGRPEDVLPRLARAVGAQAVVLQQEVTPEESRVEAAVAARLKEEGVEAQTYWGSTLFHVDDLPFALPHMPSNYSAFRQAVSRIQVRDMVEAPEHLKPMPVMGNVQPGEIPSLEALGLSAIHPPTQNAHMTSMQGGEAEALRKLSGFVAESKSAAAGSKATAPSSGQYGASFSCKISPWLAMGCLSPRRVFHQVLQLEGSLAHQLASKPAAKARLTGPKAATATAAKEPSMDWLVFELLWRDFFRFITKRHTLGTPSLSPVLA
ncbi:unnamed protein product [Closterium sp. Yama58-4]|nr:unnamed protein product [Closterium sp. Yama58-4]